jgi:hypothetical protein
MIFAFIFIAFHFFSFHRNGCNLMDRCA